MVKIKVGPLCDNRYFFIKMIGCKLGPKNQPFKKGKKKKKPRIKDMVIYQLPLLIPVKIKGLCSEYNFYNLMIMIEKRGQWLPKFNCSSSLLCYTPFGFSDKLTMAFLVVLYFYFYFYFLWNKFAYINSNKRLNPPEQKEKLMVEYLPSIYQTN